MGSYPFTSKRYDRFEVYAETAIGYHSDHDHEMELYNEWMEKAKDYLDVFGPKVKSYFDGTDHPFKLIMFDDEIPEIDEREEWDRCPLRLRMVLRNVCSGMYMDLNRVDVIVVVSEIPTKEDVEAMKARLMEVARSCCPKGKKGLFGI